MPSPIVLPDTPSLARRLVGLLVAADARHRDDHRRRDVGVTASEAPAKAEPRPWDPPGWWWRLGGPTGPHRP